MSAVRLPLPRGSLPPGNRCGNRYGHGSRAHRFQRVTPPEDARPTAPAVVSPAQQKPRIRAGFEGLPAPLIGVSSAGQELTTPCPGDMSMIYYFHNTGSVQGLHLSDSATSADLASRRTPLLPRPDRRTPAILAVAKPHARGRRS
jgi:hypothetical protein